MMNLLDGLVDTYLEFQKKDRIKDTTTTIASGTGNEPEEKIKVMGKKRNLISRMMTPQAPPSAPSTRTNNNNSNNIESRIQCLYNDMDEETTMFNHRSTLAKEDTETLQRCVAACRALREIPSLANCKSHCESLASIQRLILEDDNESSIPTTAVAGSRSPVRSIAASNSPKNYTIAAAGQKNSSIVAASPKNSSMGRNNNNFGRSSFRASIHSLGSMGLMAKSIDEEEEVEDDNEAKEEIERLLSGPWSMSNFKDNHEEESTAGWDIGSSDRIFHEEDDYQHYHDFDTALGEERYEFVLDEEQKEEQHRLVKRPSRNSSIRFHLTEPTLESQRTISVESLLDRAQGTLNLSQSILRRDSVFNIVVNQDMDVEDITYVRKPKLSKLAQIIATKKFQRYKHRFALAQRNRTLYFPTLKQPKEQLDPSSSDAAIREYNRHTEMHPSRSRHRFIITADTQFGILMDGFAMEEPNWKIEIELSRKCVQKINAMKGPDRPLFVCVCGDLVDTESSFCAAMASWKKIMKHWERHVIFQQQCKDWKEVWSTLDDDIALVCLCGNHDVGNRPTPQSIHTWTSLFGSDYLAFWVNGTYNIGLNNNLFSNPTGAPELFDEQLDWLQDRLEYATSNNAKQIFVYSHYPWFIVHEDETDEQMESVSYAPDGWGPPNTKFSDYYFNIPLDTRKMALDLFRRYNVTACFSGHFHQNVVTKTSWGMDMIITGPLSMTLTSTIQNQFGSEQQACGLRIVDVHIDDGTFQHQFVPLINDTNRQQFCTFRKDGSSLLLCQKIDTSSSAASATNTSTTSTTSEEQLPEEPVAAMDNYVHPNTKSNTDTMMKDVPVTTAV